MEKLAGFDLSFCCDKVPCATCARQESALRMQSWITTIGLVLCAVFFIAVATRCSANSKTMQPGTECETSVCSPMVLPATSDDT